MHDIYTDADNTPLSITTTNRDNEEAYVSLNDEICWTKTRILATNGEQQCGGFFKEERIPVTGCYITLSPLPNNKKSRVPLTVLVETNLDGTADDESFGIDNVVVKKIKRSNLTHEPTSQYTIVYHSIVYSSIVLSSIA